MSVHTLINKKYGSKFVLLITGLFLSLLYFVFWWSYRLDIFPGLHGDEAWFGLSAVQYSKTGIQGYHGMNYYTGILQSLLSFAAFKWLGTSVLALRIGGIIMNVIALCILCAVFIGNGQKKAFFIFLMILGQSCLYLIFPRVAWEVNTFTLLFLAINALAVVKLDRSKKQLSLLWAFIFLFTNLLGSYNHLIFSGLSIALFAGVVIWSFYAGSDRYRFLLPIFGFNALNVCVLFISEILLEARYGLRLPMRVLVAFTLAALITECMISRFLNKKVTFPFKKIPIQFIYLLLLLLFLYFCSYQGNGFLDVWFNYKIMMRIFAIKYSLFTKLLFMGCGGITVALFFWIVLSELRSSEKLLSPLLFVIIVYLGILPLYTLLHYVAIQYYLIAYILVAVYLAIKIAPHIKLQQICIPTLFLSMIAVNIALGYIYTHPDRPIQVVEVWIGNNQANSIDFMPKQPLLDSLAKNKISRIYYSPGSRERTRLLSYDIGFYRLAQPWPAISGNDAVVDIDADPNHLGGYRLYKKNEYPPFFLYRITFP